MNNSFEKWYNKNKCRIKPISDEEVKTEIEKEINFLSQMSVQEYTLYRKWLEINEKYPINNNFKNLFDDNSDTYPHLNQLKEKIWIPENTDDYLDLEPVIKCTYNDIKEKDLWMQYRTFLSTMVNSGNVGRNLKFNVWDKKTDKLLGIIDITSDFMDLTVRDDFIGWTREQRSKVNGPLLNTMIASTIIPTQPLGFSYVGGKLIALLTVSDIIQKKYEEIYESKLTGITTTSLYGSFSQYDRLKHWKKMGKSKGSVKFTPSNKIKKLIRKWLKYNHTEKFYYWYKTGRTVHDHIQRSLMFTYNKLNIDKSLIETNHQRGVYFCQLYENTKEFLREEIDESQLGNKLFDNSVENLTELWKEKYAKKRVKSLLNRDLYKTDTLFYKDLIGISWEEAKEKYLKDVGR